MVRSGGTMPFNPQELAAFAALMSAIATLLAWRSHVRASELSVLTYLRDEFVSLEYRRRFYRVHRWSNEEFLSAKVRMPEGLEEESRCLLGSPSSVHLQANTRVAPDLRVDSLGVFFASSTNEDEPGTLEIRRRVAAKIRSKLVDNEDNRDLVPGLIGSNHRRSDLTDFAVFQLRVADWVGPFGLWFSTLPYIGWPTPRVRRLQSTFGRDLLVTIYWHRRFSARIFRKTGAGRDYGYYRRYYGLSSQKLEQLTDALLRIGVRTGSIAEEDLDAAFQFESWLWKEHTGTPVSPRRRKPRWGKRSASS